MNLLSREEKIELLKNLLVDPDDWISREILRLSDEDESPDDSNPVLGIKDSYPEADKIISSKNK